MNLKTFATGAAVVAVILATLPGCSPGSTADEVASAPSVSPSAGGPTTTSGSGDGRQFAACLRSRGLDIADPAPGEQIELKTKDDKTRAALQACAQFAPATETEPDTFDPVAGRAYAACIRTKGFPDFPDPDDQGLRIPKNLASDTRYHQADRDCAPLLNRPTGGKK